MNFVSMAEAIFNLTLPVGRGTRPTGNGEIENSLSHTHKIHWPADPDWSMVVACEGPKAPPTRVNSSY